jgi:hypothetical protein
MGITEITEITEMTWGFWAWDAWWQEQLASCQRHWKGCAYLIKARGRLAMVLVFWGLVSVLSHVLNTHSSARSSVRNVRMTATGITPPASALARSQKMVKNESETRLTVVLSGGYASSSSPLVHHKPSSEKSLSPSQAPKKSQEAKEIKEAKKNALLGLVSPASLPAPMASGTGVGDGVSSGLWKEEGQSDSIYLERFQQDLLALPLKGGCTVQMRVGLSPLLETCDDPEDVMLVIDLITRHGPFPGQDNGQFFFLGFSGNGVGAGVSTNQNNAVKPE